MVISKSIRNRIVGIFVVLSIILILVPLLSNNNESNNRKSSNDDGAIAITKHGAVVDENGATVEHDYSDLLAGDDNYGQIPLNNSQSVSNTQATSPFDALNTNNQGNNLASNNILDAAPMDEPFETHKLETAHPISQTPAKPNTVVAQSTFVKPQQQTVKTEVLTSSRNSNTQAKPAASHTTTASTKLISGQYGAQVGAFSQKSQVDSVISQLKSAGFKAIPHQINVNGKQMTRVYAGVAKDKSGIQKICALVKSRLNLPCYASQL